MFRRKIHQCRCNPEAATLASVLDRMAKTNERCMDQLTQVVRDQGALIRMLTDTVVMPENDQLQRTLIAAEAEGRKVEAPNTMTNPFAGPPLRRVPPRAGDHVEVRYGGEYGGADPG